MKGEYIRNIEMDIMFSKKQTVKLFLRKISSSLNIDNCWDDEMNNKNRSDDFKLYCLLSLYHKTKIHK